MGLPDREYYTSDDAKMKQLRDAYVAHVARSRGAYDAILYDLYEGPHAATQTADDPLYGASALASDADATAFTCAP